MLVNAAKLVSYDFRFGPFLFDSEIDIPELCATSGSGSVPVRIRLGEVTEELADAGSYGRWCKVNESEYLLNIPGVARFYVANGDSVRVQLAQDTATADVSTFLLGSVFGALCHQNELLPLHASAIEVNGVVTAFLGESGAGKSTLAACLQSRGYRIVSDDICVLEGGENEMRVVPVAGWLKLWRASLNHLGESPEEHNRVYSAEDSCDDKYRLYIASVAMERPRMGNLIFLEKAADCHLPPRLEQLTHSETIALMMRLTYLSYITELTGSHMRVFRQCARTLDGARGFRLIVPWGFDQMDAVLDLLELSVVDATKQNEG